MRVVPLSSILSAQPRNGWSPPAEFQTGTGVPVLTLSAVTGFEYDGSRVKLSSAPTKESAHYWLQEGELLVTRSNTQELVGHAAICDGTPTRAICCDLIMKMRVDPNKAHTRFIYFFLRSPEARSYLTSRAQGASSTMKKIGKHVIQSIPIPLPPLPEQQRMVGILDYGFDSIATAQANAEKNLQNARDLFESYLQEAFVSDGRCPVAPIGDVADVFDGPHATPKTVDEGPIFLGISALQDGYVNLSETRHVTPEDYRRWTRRVEPVADDVVFSYETRLGQAAIIPKGLKCCLGRRMGLVRVDKRRLNSRFFVYQYISPPFRKFLDSKTVHGATVDRIALKEFPSFPIKLPSLTDQERIADQIDELREKTQNLQSLYQRKLAALEALKKSLLHQAFTGAL